MMSNEFVETSSNANGKRLLDIRNLSVDYYAASGTVHALDNVSITLERGQILGLAGESGSGKSTLAYAVTRLLHPPAVVTGGEVWYYPRSEVRKPRRRSAGAAESRAPADGGPIDILQLSPAQLRTFRWSELAIVFQSAMNALNPVLTIGAQINDVLRTHQPKMGPDSRRQRAVELLRLVGIAPDRIRSYPHELSGGMRQRAIIAIALALSPELIIMDEPTTALDVVVQREILLEIMGLRERLNFSVIFITHDLSLLLEIADKIAIMYAGRVIEMGTNLELLQQPRHPYSYGLLNSFPTLHGPRRLMPGIPGFPPDLRAVPSGCAFHPRCPMAFEACRAHIPLLRASTPETPGQLVACHLYDPRFTQREVPTNAEFAASYESAYEALPGRRRAE
ncbi:MAG TPA: ABC transporter ATP-binding protein [Ktedonobacteraceae bacterium]|nr:ABC transporter ATP-binding protein [Ktedonobacteraceae bacterium]